MSLINDALKRAKEAENKNQAPGKGSEKAQPAREPAMRPTEPKQQSASVVVYVLSAALVCVLLGAGVLIWIWSGSNQKGGTRTENVAAATSPSVAPVAQAQPVTAKTPEVASPKPAVVSPNVASANIQPAASVEKPAPVHTPAASTDAVVAEVPPAAPIEPVAPPAPAVPQFPTLKLQGIFYNSTKPSTVINGKTYSTGAVVSGARIVRIEVDKVTVEWNGETRILETAQ